MNCPFCGNSESKVVDSRDTEAGDAIRRRRECLVCERRFTTYERVDEMPLLVAKRDGHTEVFERSKLLRGLVRACVKRDIPMPRLERLVDEIENRLRQSPGEPVSSVAIGEHALRLLRALDKVAYVRFASVYRQFEDVEEFQEELRRLEDDVPELEGQRCLLEGPEGEPAWITGLTATDSAARLLADAAAVRSSRYTARREAGGRVDEGEATSRVHQREAGSRAHERQAGVGVNEREASTRRSERAAVRRPAAEEDASRDLAVSGQHREGA